MPNRLRGLKIVVTRAREQAGKLADLLEAEGAEVIVFPTIEIRPSGDPPPFHQHTKFDWTVFTSANGVKHFAAKVEEADFDIGRLQLGRVCAVGPGTKMALERIGIAVEPLPGAYLAESIFDYVQQQDSNLSKKRVLLPRGNIARDMLLFAFRSSGAIVTPWIVYGNEPVPHSSRDVDTMIAARPDLVTFTSASTARAFRDAVGDKIGELDAGYASIGPFTTEAATDCGLKVAIEAEQHNIPGLVDAIAEWAQARKAD